MRRLRAELDTVTSANYQTEAAMPVEFTPDDELADELAEFVPVNELYLQDGTCWISDPDLLAHDSGADGVLAVQFMEGGLFYLDGETRKWMNVEPDSKGKAQARLRPVN